MTNQQPLLPYCDLRPLPETLGRRTDTHDSYQALRPETLHLADGLLFISTPQEAE